LILGGAGDNRILRQKRETLVELFTLPPALLK